MRNIFDVIREFGEAGKDPSKVEEIKRLFSTQINTEFIKNDSHILIDFGSKYHTIIVVESEPASEGVDVTMGYLIEGSYKVKSGTEKLKMKEIPEQEPHYFIESKLAKEKRVFIIDLKRR